MTEQEDYDLDSLCYHADRDYQKRLLGKLSTPELRVLLVHFKLANDAEEARYSPIPDRERGALKRLAAIMARYPKLTAYVQGDPRGCALYILKPGDVPDGERVDAYYSRGLAVHR